MFLTVHRGLSPLRGARVSSPAKGGRLVSGRPFTRKDRNRCK